MYIFYFSANHSFFQLWKFPSDKVATLSQTLLSSKDLPSSHDWLMLDKKDQLPYHKLGQY